MTGTGHPTEKPKKERTSNIPVQLECKVSGKTRWLIWNTEFEIDDKYVPIKAERRCLQAVGKGAYGTVCSAREKATGQRVAIKKIANCFGHIVDARRTLRECMLLRHLKHENVIGLREILQPATKDFKDLYIVQDLMDTDLHQIIRSSQPLSNDHFQHFIYQVLRGLKYIHTANVLHRDLKPSNLLLNASCDLKICDFGLARTSTERNFMTEYVVTRWYRAPELLLSCDHYAAAIDVWSVGCILAELLLRKPFFPGKDYMDQLRIIIAQLGMPSDEELSFITNDRARQFIQDMGALPGTPFRIVFPEAHPDALDLLERMLTFDPRKRISVEEALQHSYVASIRTDEPSAPSAFSFRMEDEDLDQVMVRQMVWEEIQHYHSATQAAVGGANGWGQV